MLSRCRSAVPHWYRVPALSAPRPGPCDRRDSTHVSICSVGLLAAPAQPAAAEPAGATQHEVPELPAGHQLLHPGQGGLGHRAAEAAHRQHLLAGRQDVGRGRGPALDREQVRSPVPVRREVPVERFLAAGQRGAWWIPGCRRPPPPPAPPPGKPPSGKSPPPGTSPPPGPLTARPAASAPPLARSVHRRGDGPAARRLLPEAPEALGRPVTPRRDLRRRPARTLRPARRWRRMNCPRTWRRARTRTTPPARPAWPPPRGPGGHARRHQRPAGKSGAPGHTPGTAASPPSPTMAIPPATIAAGASHGRKPRYPDHR